MKIPTRAVILVTFYDEKGDKRQEPHDVKREVVFTGCIEECKSWVKGLISGKELEKEYGVGAFHGIYYNSCERTYGSHDGEFVL